MEIGSYSTHLALPIRRVRITGMNTGEGLRGWGRGHEGSPPTQLQTPRKAGWEPST